MLPNVLTFFHEEKMYDRLGLQWASWLLAFIGVAMVFIPYIFYFFGAAINRSYAPERSNLFP
jgi:uncharacterized membrane protein